MLGQKTLYVVAAVEKVFPNEATAFHPSLPQRSRLASRVSPLGLAARKLLSSAERRMQMASVAWNSSTLWTFALHAGRACNPVAIQTSAVESTAVAKSA